MGLNELYDSFFQDEKRICPKCHMDFWPGECEIVATFPPHTRGEVLYPAKKGLFRRRNPKPISGKDMRRLATRVCPECGYYLPRNIDTTMQLNIAVVGDHQSGKSHFLASLIKQLRDERVVPDDEHFRLFGMTPLIEDKYEQDYLGRLHKNHELVPRTAELRPGDSIEPLIYELTFRHSKDYRPKTVNLVIHDASGEDYRTPEKIVEFTQHVVNASALIYLANPVALPDIDKRLPADINRPSDVRSPTITFNTIIKLIEEFRGLHPGSKLADLPTAVVISKSDLLKKLRSPSNPFAFSENPRYRGGVDLLDLAKVGQEVEEVLNSYAGDRSLIPATQAIEKMRFFAVSATGRPPDSNGSYPSVEPIRCLDPFLWILYELELIPKSR